MAKTTWGDETTIETIASTGLNSLADDDWADSSEDNNGTDQELYGDFELYVSGFGGSVAQDQEVAQMWILSAIDGTNYPDGLAADNHDPEMKHFVGSFVKKDGAGTGAVRLLLEGVRLPPRDFKCVVKNVAGQTWAASSNTLKMIKYSVQSN